MTEAKKSPKLKELRRKCACCGKEIKVTLYKDHTYRGGHYFCKIPINNKTVEYWECPRCYW